MVFWALADLLVWIRHTLEAIYELHSAKTEENRQTLRTRLQDLESSYAEYRRTMEDLSGDLDSNHADKLRQDIQDHGSDLEKTCHSLVSKIDELLAGSKRRSTLEGKLESLRSSIDILSKWWLEFRNDMEFDHLEKAKAHLIPLRRLVESSYAKTASLAKNELAK